MPGDLHPPELALPGHVLAQRDVPYPVVGQRHDRRAPSVADRAAVMEPEVQVVEAGLIRGLLGEYVQEEPGCQVLRGARLLDVGEGSSKEMDVELRFGQQRPGRRRQFGRPGRDDPEYGAIFQVRNRFHVRQRRQVVVVVVVIPIEKRQVEQDHVGRFGRVSVGQLILHGRQRRRYRTGADIGMKIERLRVARPPGARKPIGVQVTDDVGLGPLLRRVAGAILQPLPDVVVIRAGLPNQPQRHDDRYHAGKAPGACVRHDPVQYQRRRYQQRRKYRQQVPAGKGRVAERQEYRQKEHVRRGEDERNGQYGAVRRQEAGPTPRKGVPDADYRQDQYYRVRGDRRQGGGAHAGSAPERGVQQVRSGLPQQPQGELSGQVVEADERGKPVGIVVSENRSQDEYVSYQPDAEQRRRSGRPDRCVPDPGTNRSVIPQEDDQRSGADQRHPQVAGQAGGGRSDRRQQERRQLPGAQKPVQQRERDHDEQDEDDFVPRVSRGGGQRR